jgi:MFS transporter, FSR family, fosmidomycin resistance protein
MGMGTAAAGSLRHDMRVISLIGGAHFFSHFYQLVLPPLFPLLRAEFDVSYTALGLLTGIFFITGAITQPAMGFLVDRYGARPILLAGLALIAAAVALLGLAPGYWALVPIMILSGLGNAVFHPADFAILNASVHPSRLGRAYGVHGILGNIGWAAAPIASLSLSAAFGWRTALVVLGCCGLAATVYLASQGAAMMDHRRSDKGPAPAATSFAEDLAMLTRPTILVTFAFFALTSMALVGIQTFVPTALTSFHGVPLAAAAVALTAFLLAGAAGTLGGGVLVDRFKRPELIVGLCLALFAVVFLAFIWAGLPDPLIIPIMAITGALLGATGPSRDMLVRQKTQVGASGKVYGFVYSGLDLGAAITPPLFGWLIDHGEAQLVFVFVSAVIALSVLTIFTLDRRSAGVPST